jgi:pimeloyl-ACP methyl ester carboxylesterase
MTKVLVHGVPETGDIWGPLLTQLAHRGVDDVVALSPPGFGAPTPADWSATPGAYVDWLAQELELLDPPVDVLGHDWGTGHVLGLALRRPELLRSWAVDVAGLLHPDYEWHELAQQWQTPEVGEQIIEAMLGLSVADRAAAYEAAGAADHAIAHRMAEAMDPTMGSCILTLYRHGAQPYLRHLGEELVTARPGPGLVLTATEDAYVDADLGREMAARLGAQHVPLTGQGHWWMLSRPDLAADALVDFWSR